MFDSQVDNPIVPSEFQSSPLTDSDPYGLAPDANSTPSALRAAPNPADIDLEVIGASWVAQGAAPAINGQVENVRPGNNITGDENEDFENQVVGAIHTVLADPHDADTLWAGAVNGGIWKTTNATHENPH